MSESFREHETAWAFLKRTVDAGSPWCLAWPVLYEFLRITTHPRILPTPLTPGQALEFLDSLLRSETLHLLTPTERHEEALRQTVSEMAHPAGNLFYDIQIAALLREHGVPEIVTADTDFLQFRFLKVTDPIHPTR